MLETIREPNAAFAGLSLKLTDLSVQDNLEYTATWNQVMLQSDVRIPPAGTPCWMDGRTSLTRLLIGHEPGHGRFC